MIVNNNNITSSKSRDERRRSSSPRNLYSNSLNSNYNANVEPINKTDKTQRSSLKSTIGIENIQTNNSKSSKYTQKGTNSSDSGDSVGIKCSSPTTWICDFSKDTLQDVFFPKSPPKSIQETKKNDSWRLSTTKTILSDDSDDDEHGKNNIPTSSNVNNNPTVRTRVSSEKLSLGRFTPNSKEYNNKMQDDLSIALSVNSFLTSNSATSNYSQRNSLINSSGEARIVAPNVSKLSPNSAVEVKLKSPNETVAVLCSVDVLKMRSGFFHDILSEQEKNRIQQQQQVQQLPKTSGSSSLIWREPITVIEIMPFEAAAYLESLHEGRALFRGEWNYCWARLSVNWIIEDMIMEYAAQIEAHMNKLVTCVRSKHWRTNCNILNGMKVAAFRKGSNNMPSLISGSVIEASSSVGYSKVRVVFDNNSNNTMAASRYPSPTSNNNYNNKQKNKLDSESIKSSDNINNNNTNDISLQSHQAIGDLAEPFWVQGTKEGSVWIDPDDLSRNEIKRYITKTDKRIFWEMARSIIEQPQLSMNCKSGITDANELTNVLKKIEFRILWTNDAPQYLPKQMATDLLLNAYVNEELDNTD